jgi:hypothetical protein
MDMLDTFKNGRKAFDERRKKSKEMKKKKEVSNIT